MLLLFYVPSSPAKKKASTAYCVAINIIGYEYECLIYGKQLFLLSGRMKYRWAFLLDFLSEFVLFYQI